MRTHLCWQVRFFRHPVERLFNNVDIQCTTSYPWPLRGSPGYEVDPIMVFRVSTAHPNDALAVDEFEYEYQYIQLFNRHLNLQKVLKSTRFRN